MSYNAYRWNFVPQTVTTKEDLGLGIVDYGRNNTYPQEVEYAIDKSGIATACVNAYSNFLKGKGFVNGGDRVVNDKGETLNDILRQISKPCSKFGGFALHLNVNAMGEYTSMEVERFTYVRLKIPEDRKIFTTVRISDAWADESWRNDANQFQYVEKDLFNPMVLDSALQEVDLEEYEGQILYHTSNKGFYPASPYHAVIEQVLTTGELSKFDRSFVLNGFAASMIFVNKTLSMNDEVYESNISEINKMAGSKSAGGVYYLEGDIDTVDLSKANKISQNYETIKGSSKEDIRLVQNIPSILIGESRQGGFPNQEEFVNAFDYMNGIIQEPQQEVCRVFDRINEVFYPPLLPQGQKFEIEPLKFGSDAGNSSI